MSGYVVLMNKQGESGLRSHIYKPRGPLSKPFTACGFLVRLSTDKRESEPSLSVCGQCERRKP